MKEKEEIKKCTDCKNTKCEQIRWDIVQKNIAGKSPELFAGSIENCFFKKQKDER